MIELLIDLLSNPPTFLIMALIGGLLVATISAPLGVFMVWQKQSYFGATLAHSALLGVGLGLLLDINPTYAVIFVSIAIGFSLFMLEQKSQLATDTLLGILAHSSLALGLIVLSLQPDIQIDLMSYLFGDILSIELFDIGMLLSLMLLVGLFFSIYWNQLLNITLNKELAETDGINTQKVQLGYILLLALLISLAIKIVGILLITSLLIIPAAAAHRLSKTPEQMLNFAFIAGIISVISGLLMSITLDTPTGPSIVICATVIFLTTLFKEALNN
jgi:zinc transport system permease protein